jgi:hypothetical protein
MTGTKRHIIDRRVAVLVSATTAVAIIVLSVVIKCSIHCEKEEVMEESIELLKGEVEELKNRIDRDCCSFSMRCDTIQAVGLEVIVK